MLNSHVKVLHETTYLVTFLGGSQDIPPGLRPAYGLAVLNGLWGYMQGHQDARKLCLYNWYEKM